MFRHTCILFLLLVLAGSAHPQDDPTPVPPDASLNPLHRNFARNVFDLFNMAGTDNARQFRPLSQSERNRLYIQSMINPLSFVRVAASAAIDQAKDKPEEWEQGASGYGKRNVNIFAQYSIQRTVTYGLGSLLHEDNRYFNSGTARFWPRTRYALSSAFLARHDDGSRRFSLSQVGGVAAGAFLARVWLPPSQSSPTDAAVSFGITTATNLGFSAVKEFLPDMIRPLTRKQKP